MRDEYCLCGVIKPCFAEGVSMAETVKVHLAVGGGGVVGGITKIKWEFKFNYIFH